MTPSEAKAAVKQHGGIRQAARALGVAPTTLRGWIEGATPRGKPTARKEPKKAEGKAAGRSLAEFRSVYDKDTIIPTKIKAAIAKLAERGPEAWEYEVEFAKLAGVSLYDLNAYRDQFSDFWLVTSDKRKVWACSRKLCKQLKEYVS